MRFAILAIATTALALSGCDDGSPEPDPAPQGTTTEDSAADDTPTPPPVGTTTDETPATTTGADDGVDDGVDDEGGSSTGEVEVTCPYEDPGWQHYGQGVQIPHWQLETHTGEIWEACDYFGSPLVLDTSAVWCGPCNSLSAFMAGNDAAASGIFGSNTDFIENYAKPFRDMVNAGCITWVTILTKDAQDNPATLADAEAWDAQYHNPNIPVVADPTGDFEWYLHINAYPTTYLVNNDFTYLTDDFSGGIQLVVDNLECDLSGM